MKKILLVLAFLLLSTTLASALVGIDSVNKKQFNLGDKLTISYNLTNPTDMEALFKLGLKCQSFDLDYYVIPVTLKAGQNKSIVAPPLSINNQMSGRCSVRAELTSTDKSYSESLQSDEFDVTNIISIKIETNGKNFLPGEKVELTGTIEESFNPQRTLSIILERQSINLLVSNPGFNQTLELPKTMKSGTHRLLVQTNDSFGNIGEGQLILTIAQVPTSIIIDSDKERVNPGDHLRMHAIILDQANDSMPGIMSLKMANQDKKELFSEEVESSQIFNHTFSSQAAPGVYTIKASTLGLKAERRIFINTIEEVTSSFDGTRTLKVKNTGNVNYDKFIEARLATEDGKDVVLVKKVNLKPGESAEFDLYKEVPADTYTISFTSNGQEKSYKGVSTTDERGVMKKLGDGLKAATGMVVGTGSSEGLLFKKPFLALITVVAIIILLVVVYRSERTRRAELSRNQEEQIEVDRAKETLLKKPHAESSESKAKPERTEEDKKFVENMLKEKEFK